MNNQEAEAMPSTSVPNIVNLNVDDDESEVTSSSLLAEAVQMELNASNDSEWQLKSSKKI